MCKQKQRHKRFSNVLSYILQKTYILSLSYKKIDKIIPDLCRLIAKKHNYDGLKFKISKMVFSNMLKGRFI